MNPLDAPLVARDVWLSAEDGTTPTDQSAAHFVLRMFDGYPDDEAILNAIAARLTRELAYREMDRAKDRLDGALATFRAAHPWMEPLAERLWPGHWTWHGSQSTRYTAPSIFHIAGSAAPSSSWRAGGASSVGPTITMRHQGWQDGGEGDGSHDTPRTLQPGVYLSGMALDHYHMILSARSPAEMVTRYQAWLSTVTIHRRGYMGAVRPSPRSRAGRDLAAWVALEAEGAVESERHAAALLERIRGQVDIEDVEKRTYSATPGMRNEYVDLVMGGLRGTEP